ncbi:hypothetical protein QPK87_31640 [Kamptonema cortianum]|nr:hypothetical protein [Geitlerinema splendidum]MDK3161078.1 hypothetical protein [Kamptonema cortianum]
MMGSPNHISHLISDGAIPDDPLDSQELWDAAHTAMILSIQQNAGETGLVSTTDGNGSWESTSNGLKFSWSLLETGVLAQSSISIDGIPIFTTELEYDAAAMLERVFGTPTGGTRSLFAETVRDESNNIMGLYDYVSNRFHPISLGIGSGQPQLINAYNDCIRACNTTGRACTRNARRKAASAAAAALATYAAAMTGAGISILFTGGTSTPAAVAAMGAATVALGLATAVINVQLRGDLKECRIAYDDCTRGCRLAHPELVPPPSTGGGTS